MHRTIVSALLLAIASPAIATVAQVPEPDTIGLLLAGGVAGLVAWIRHKRKNKR